MTAPPTLVTFPTSTLWPIRSLPAWGDMDATSFTKSLESAYKETVHWKKNCFRIPQGKAGKSFIHELAHLFHAFATGSALESVALKAATVLALLILQKSHHNSKPKEHAACLERRMKLWEEGNITELVRDGRVIQNRIPNHQSQGAKQQLARSFVKLMFQGKTHATLQLLTDKGKEGVLHLHDTINNGDAEQITVKDVLKSKHPPPPWPGSNPWIVYVQEFWWAANDALARTMPPLLFHQGAWLELSLWI